MRIKKISLLVVCALMLSLVSCSTPVQYSSDIETVMFTDSADRTVEVPKDITRVAPSGAVATMILATLCPEYMVCVSSTPSSAQYKYLPERLLNLPTTGQLYGAKSTINLESLIEASPQIIIDLGDPKENIDADMDALQKTTGIATVFINADLYHIADAYRSMGELLGLEERAEEIASFLDETMAMAEENSAKIPEAERKSVMYTTGTTGLNVNAFGSVQTLVLDIVGVDNAIVLDAVSNQSGGNTIDMEQLYQYNPDVIVFTSGSVYSTVSDMAAWSDVKAIQNGTYYETPYLPYNWMSNPPSINMSIGVWWLGNLVYPEVYDYDMVEVAQRIYRLFWNYDLTIEEAQSMLANSTLKDADL
ncbi:MAG: ABC transporter substrate-binding protein [Oscillospiraceae bacterium]|nr:ABC transporter substrate-binding protein [Oscillospiraceae bacterium]